MCSSIRIQVRSSAVFVRQSEQGVQRIRGHFHSLPQLVNSSAPLDVDGILNSLNEQVENFSSRGSGYVIERLLQFILVITEYRPLCGSSYIPTPKRLRNKKCIVNVQNADQKCFLYAILSCLHESPINKNRVKNYTPFINTLNVDGLSFPVETHHIPIFEQANPQISINVLAVDKYDTEKRRYSYCIEYASPHRNRPHHINLLLLEDEKDPSRKHYTWIRNMSRLMADRSKHTAQSYVCMMCYVCVYDVCIIVCTVSQRKRRTIGTCHTARYTPPNTSSTPMTHI